MYYGKCSSKNLKLIPPFIVHQNFNKILLLLSPIMNSSCPALMFIQYMKHVSFFSHPKIKVSSL